MRIGLVTDIHDEADLLEAALAALEARGIDLLVTLGDTCDVFGPSDGRGAARVAALLLERGVIGVWGNHDLSLCRNVDERFTARFAGTPVLAFLATMQPTLVVDDCHFSHREPLGDPHDPAFLWSLGGEDSLGLELLPRDSFAAVEQRLLFVGHYHRWWAATSEGPIDWAGEGPLELRRGRRYFVVVGAVADGWCGWLDTEAGLLVPVHVSEARH